MTAESLTAIIAERNPLQRNRIGQMCGRAGVHVLAAVDSGTRFIDECLARRPDIVLTDIALDRLDGISALRQIHEAGCRPLVLFITGSLDPQHMLAALNEFRTVAYLTKPVCRERFDQAMLRAAEWARTERPASRRAASPHRRWIRLTVGYRETNIAEDSIAYVEVVGKRRLRVVLTTGEMIEATGTLREIQIQSDTLFSPHRAYLVHPGNILATMPDPVIAGNYMIRLRDADIAIPLTRRKYKALRMTEVRSGI